jgi:hypothetical protein
MFKISQTDDKTACTADFLVSCIKFHDTVSVQLTDTSVNLVTDLSVCIGYFETCTFYLNSKFSYLINSTI